MRVVTMLHVEGVARRVADAAIRRAVAPGVRRGGRRAPQPSRPPLSRHGRASERGHCTTPDAARRRCCGGWPAGRIACRFNCGLLEKDMIIAPPNRSQDWHVHAAAGATIREASVPDTKTVPHYHWNRAEYERASRPASSAPTRGWRSSKEPSSPWDRGAFRHFTGIELVVDALRRTFGAGHRVRVQGPLAAGDDSEPEPDVAVVAGGARDFRDGHPTTALLVVEVSDDSLRHDRTVKQRLYARCGVPEYWILALPVERSGSAPRPGRRRLPVRSIHRPGETVAPLAHP